MPTRQTIPLGKGAESTYMVAYIVVFQDNGTYLRETTFLKQMQIPEKRFLRCQSLNTNNLRYLASHVLSFFFFEQQTLILCFLMLC